MVKLLARELHIVFQAFIRPDPGSGCFTWPMFMLQLQYVIELRCMSFN